MTVPFPASSSHIEVVIKATLTDAGGFTKPIVNLLHYGFVGTGPTTLPNLTTFLVNLKAALAASWKAAKPAGYVCTEVSARWMENTATGAVLDPTPGDYTGTGPNAAGDWLPPDASAYIEKSNPLWRGKPYRGGIRLSPVLATHVANFELSGAGITAYGNIATAMLVNISDGTNAYAGVVYSQTYSTIPPTPGVATIVGTPFTTARVRKTLGSMDRRKPRGQY